MKVILHDLDEKYNESIMVKCDELIHATLRYGKHKMLRVIVYSDITDREKETFTYLTKLPCPHTWHHHK